MEQLADVLIDELSERKEKILQTICKCVCALSEKTSIYTTLVGILNSRKFELGEELLDILVNDLKTALVMKQFNKSKQLVRFLADLVNAKVVASSSIISLFDTFLTVTYEPDIPQVRSDWYVNMVLSALPWVGAELEERKHAEVDRLFASLDVYMSKRTTPYLPAFQVWISDHPHPQNDALEVLWIQVKAMRAKDWKDHVLLRPYRMDSVIGGYSHPLPSISVPGHSEDQVYPLPTIVFRFFTNDDLCFADPGSVLPSGDSIDRYLLEDAITCILASHQDNRKECASALNLLTKRIQDYNLTPMNYIIVEVLFGFILQLPSPPQVPIYYSSVFIELCKTNPETYPRILEQITKLFFAHLDKMNVVAVSRLAKWFALHLSNYQFIWKWVEWSSVMRGRMDHPCVCFLRTVFEHCIRLGIYDDFMETVPQDFGPIFPREPTFDFKYNLDTETPPVESQVASKLLEAIKSKEGEQALNSIIDSLPSVNPELSLDRNKCLAVKVFLVTQCILYVGHKTISHSFMALTKFRPLLKDLITSDAGKIHCLEAVAEFYASNSQLHMMMVDKLMKMQIVDVMTVLNWLFSENVTPHFTQQYVWDILASTVLKTNRSHDQAIKELADTNEELKKVSDLDEVAMGSEERQILETRVEELEEKVEECMRTQKNMFLVICQRMIVLLTEHLSTCDQESMDYETTWFLTTLDNFRQLLVDNYGPVSKYSGTLESHTFTSDVDSRILEVFQQFQALL